MDVVTCPVCRTPAEPGETICGHCGADLPEPIVVPSPPVAPPPNGPGHGDDPFAEIDVRLTIEGPRGRREVTVRTGDLIEVGSGHGPLMDLCTDNISRRHAEVRIGAACVEVLDTGSDGRGSTNGTFVDGRRLPPATPTRVSDGQVISFASDPPLTIRVTVVSQ